MKWVIAVAIPLLIAPFFFVVMAALRPLGNESRKTLSALPTAQRRVFKALTYGAIPAICFGAAVGYSNRILCGIVGGMAVSVCLIQTGTRL